MYTSTLFPVAMLQLSNACGGGAIVLLTWWLLGCGSATGSIGAILGQNHHTGRVMVRGVPVDMNAAKAGVMVDDEVLTIDGLDVRSMSSEQIHDALSGPIGTQVSLTLRRGEDIFRVKVKRGKLQKASKNNKTTR